MRETVIAQPVRTAQTTVIHHDRLGPHDRITETGILGLFHRRGQAIETSLDRLYRPDLPGGTCLGDRKNRIVMMSVNGAKNSSEPRN
jgi:hypothetical protein